jgi:energy-coupling factor transporter ATP-binding protein EcfA2
MFENTLGLSDNPFNPLFPTDQSIVALRNLGGRPLPMDLVTQHPVLKTLFCCKLKAVAENEAKVREVLFGLDAASSSNRSNGPGGAGGSANPGGSGGPGGTTAAPGVSLTPAADRVIRQPAVLVISGNKGSGKTTFARYLKQLILSAAEPKSWRVFDKEFNSTSGPDLTVFPSELASFEADVLSKIGPGGSNALIILDNIPKLGFPRVADFHKRLDSHFALFVVSTEDSTLQQSELDWYSSKVRLFEMSNITGQELRLYIEARVTHFRSPQRPEIDRVSPLFPFSGSFADTSERPPQPLRVLNKQLERMIEDRHRKQVNESGPDVTRCSEEELNRVLIE